MGQGNLGTVKSKKVIWKRLKARLSEPMVDASITFTQFLELKKKAGDKDKAANDRLLKLKAGPGNWTAAKYSGTSRKVAEVEGKSCIVYDLDFVTHEQLDYIREGFAEINAFAWFMHTSRSHSPEKPRVRLVIPASRLMLPEEAFAIHRLLALYLADDPEEAVEIPDLVSFRTNQTLFWPSISKGQEFWTDENVAAVFDVDDFLEAHPDWTNHETLPHQERETNRGSLDPNRRMEDPREKPNPIGAFCRAFTVEDVIERWLSDVYQPGDSEGRYTYLPGSSSNGAIVYDDDLVLFSNHGTDPIEGAANAWDLLRLHMFGEKDRGAHGNTSPMNLPSSKAMVELARSLPEVLGEEFGSHDDLLEDLEDGDEDEEDNDVDSAPSALEKEAEEPAGDDDVDDEAKDLLGDMLDELEGAEDMESRKKKPDSSWMANFRRKATGDLEPVLNNAQLILMNDPRFKDSIGYNEFTHDPVCFKPIRSKAIPTPSRAVPRRERKTGRRWEDGDDYAISAICSGNAERKGYEVDFADNTIQKAVLIAGRANPVNPVKDDIEECYRRWKEASSPTGLLDTFGIKYLGLPDTPFHRESPAMLIVGSVARTYEPGCKLDIMLVLEGKTGSGKSTFWQVLFLDQFTTELKCDLTDTGRLIEQTRAFRFVEMAEMTAAKKVDANTLKMQLSSARDVHRLAYGKREMEFPRQFIFGGTSNDDDYLTDPTSTRRYWVWRTDRDMHNRIDRDALQAERHLIWGEAYQRYLDMRQEQPHGGPFLDVDGDMARERDVIAEGSRRRTAVEEIADVVEDWLNKPRRACDVMIDEDGLTLPEFEGDETAMIRNMVTAQETYTELRFDDVLSQYRNATTATYGKALALVPGWALAGKFRRFGLSQRQWYSRGGQDGPRWIPAPARVSVPADDEEDDLLG
ncbi:MAG: VapE domain-containing protein [Pseudomonadota bacterium]